jgi:hypothetical protein
MDTRRYVLVSLISAAVLVAAGCGSSPSTQQSPQASSSPTSSAPASPPAVASLIDARWMGFDTSRPWNWQEVERRLVPGFQRFGFRPVGETTSPRPCQGCGINPPTVEVTVYNPGVYDPSGARTGRPVDVSGRSGFIGVPQRDHPINDPNYPILDPSEIFASVMLVWEYDDNAWATVRAMTPMTSDLDRMLELARAVRPDERTPVRLPLSLRFMPANMPLAAVHTDFMPVYSATSDVGTTLAFGACASDVKGDECAQKAQESGSFGIEILQRDDYPESSVLQPVDRTIGGRDGRSDPKYLWAAIQVEKGVYVEFNLISPRTPERTQETDDAARTQFDEVLNSVTWAPDLANEASWPMISDWA